MKILITGSGGREHALAWKVAQSPLAEAVFIAPGNAGTELEPGLSNVPIDAMDFPALVAFAKKEGIGLTVVGPEAPLVAGMVDYFTAQGLPCFGPSKAAAQLEGSKAFSKDFMQRHGIPTAAYQTFTDGKAARDYIKQQSVSRAKPLVIKADGLAAGKGVVVAHSEQDALAAAESMLAGERFGEAGQRVVVEEFLPGEEASFIALVGVGSGQVLPMATSQDHKARDEGDKGPNTGGMGAYSPAPVVTAEVEQRIMSQIILPTVAGMAADGNPYTGFLYAGLMISPAGEPAVVEFNCRFGDPEAQPLMLRLQSDLPRLCLAALGGELEQETVEWDSRPAVGVVLAAEGYPGTVHKGDVIHGLKTHRLASESGNQAAAQPSMQPLMQKTFHAGTAMQGDKVVTAGGRVLCATALGATVTAAQQAAYELADSIRWHGVYYRRDIAHRALAREKKKRQNK